jgi:hypothetical protein
MSASGSSGAALQVCYRRKADVLGGGDPSGPTVSRRLESLLLKELKESRGCAGAQAVRDHPRLAIEKSALFQVGDMLTQDEVLQINLITKKSVSVYRCGCS